MEDKNTLENPILKRSFRIFLLAGLRKKTNLRKRKSIDIYGQIWPESAWITT